MCVSSVPISGLMTIPQSLPVHSKHPWNVEHSGMGWWDDSSTIPYQEYTIWLFVTQPWNITIFKNGKPSISIWAIEKPWRTVSHNQRVVEITHHLGYLFFEAIATLDADTNDERRWSCGSHQPTSLVSWRERGSSQETTVLLVNL